MSSSRAGRHEHRLNGDTSRSPSVKISSSEHLTNGHVSHAPVHYTAHHGSTGTSSSSAEEEQFKNPLRASEKVLQSIHEQAPPVSSIAAEVHNPHEEYNEDVPVEDNAHWGEVSDVGQEMQQQLRDEVWSIENDEEDSFDDDEEFDGDLEGNDFPSDRIVLGKQIGRGSFGKVFEANAHGIIEGESVTQVIVKVSKNKLLQYCYYGECLAFNMIIRTI